MRLITEKEEQALRLCHHNFQGLSRTEAAAKMNISYTSLSRLLTKIKKVLPQYFPIITKLESKIYHCYMNEGWTIKQIAVHMQLSENAIYCTFQRLRKKGIFFPRGKAHHILSYDPTTHDHQIKERF